MTVGMEVDLVREGGGRAGKKAVQELGKQTPF